MLKLKLQYFGHLMRRADSIEKTLMLGKIDGRRRRGRQRMRWLDGWHHRLNGHRFEWTLGVGDGQGSLACCSSWGRKESDTTERLNWTELSTTLFIFFQLLPWGTFSVSTCVSLMYPHHWGIFFFKYFLTFYNLIFCKIISKLILYS